MGRYESCRLGREEVRMLEWKGLLGGLGPERCLGGMKLGPHPRGWKTCGDPRRKVVLGWGRCERWLGPYRIGVGCGHWL